MKKDLLLILALAASMPVAAEVFFEDGMVWNTVVTGTHDPSAQAVDVVTELSGTTDVGGYAAFNMYTTTGDDARRLVAVMRADGDKIYFLNHKDSDEWTLLYDFGLQPGEGCVVGSVTNRWSEGVDPHTTYVKCTSAGIDTNYPGWDVMQMEEYATPECTECLGKGVWLRGLGSLSGVLGNNLFEGDGVGSRLLTEVSLGSRCLFRNHTAGVEDAVVTGFAVTTDGATTVISGADPSQPLAVYDVAGSTVMLNETPGDTEYFTAPAPGVYVIANGVAKAKVVIR